MNVINVCGNALSVYGLKRECAVWRSPTLVSRAVAAVLILVLASNRANELHITKEGFLHFDGGMMKNILGSACRMPVKTAFSSSDV